MVELNPEGVSAELKQSRRWVLWQMEDVQDREKLRKQMKPPKNARTGEPAKHNDPLTWSTYEEALKAHQETLPLQPSANCVHVHEGVRGIGCVIGPPFIGIDIDDCRNPETGDLTAEAKAWVEELQTLTEVSPSGTGLHLWVHGEPPYVQGHRKDNVEIYSCNRYLTITGFRLPDTPEEILRITNAQASALYARVKAGRCVTDSVTQPSLISGTCTAKLADMMTRRDWVDRSQFFMSLLTRLAMEHNCDPAIMEAEILKSEVGKSRCPERWPRLKESEIALAIQHARENLANRRPGNSRDEIVSSGLDYSMGDEVTPEVLEMVWEGVFAKGKHHHIQGPSSQGKSPAIREIASRVTTHREMPDKTPNGFDGPKVVIIMNLEDDIADTMVPEMMSYGADMSRVAFIRMSKVVKRRRESEEQYEERRQFALGEDIDKLRQMIHELEARFGEGSVGMVIVDPCSSHLGKASMNKEEEVRQVLGPFVDLAREFHLVSITVGHLNKSDSTDPLRRSMGAAAFCGMARFVWTFGPDPQNKSAYAHVMAPGRGAVEDGSFQYHTEKKEFEFTARDGTKRKTSVIQVIWDGKSTVTAEDALAPTTRKDKSKQDKAAVELKNFLRTGKRRASDCISFMKTGGFDLDKLNSGEIRRKAGVQSVQKDGCWWWSLPTAQQEFEVPTARKENDAPLF
jgi:hypothetical protein